MAWNWRQVLKKSITTTFFLTKRFNDKAFFFVLLSFLTFFSCLWNSRSPPGTLSKLWIFLFPKWQRNYINVQLIFLRLTLGGQNKVVAFWVTCQAVTLKRQTLFFNQKCKDFYLRNRQYFPPTNCMSTWGELSSDIKLELKIDLDEAIKKESNPSPEPVRWPKFYTRIKVVCFNQLFTSFAANNIRFYPPHWQSSVHLY